MEVNLFLEAIKTALENGLDVTLEQEEGKVESKAVGNLSSTNRRTEKLTLWMIWRRFDDNGDEEGARRNGKKASDAPCKDCRERTMTCHDDCEKYKTIER